MFKFFKSNHGISLIETLVTVGIVAIVASATASMFISQQKEAKALYQKSEIVELKNLLIQVFKDPSICTWQLKNKVIDVSSTTPTVQSPTVLDLTELRQGPDITSALIVKKGQELSLSNYGLIVESVLFTKILATGNPNEYKGFFEIQFTSSSLIRPVKPVLYQQIFKTVAADPLASKKISVCLGPLNGSIGIGNYVTVPTNVVLTAESDGFLMLQVGGNNASDNDGYICSGADLSKVTECYGVNGSGPGAATILSRSMAYGGTSAMIKKGAYYQVQGFDPNGDGGSTTGIWLPLGQ